MIKERAGLPAYFAAMLTLVLIRILFNFFPFAISNNTLNMLFTILSQIFAMGIVPITVYLLLSKGSKKQALTELAVGSSYKMTNGFVIVLTLIIAVLFRGASSFFSVISNMIITLVGYTHVVSAPTIYTSFGDLVGYIILIAVLPAIFEEFVHRGLLLGSLRKYGDKVAIIVSGFMFALMHQNIVQFFYAFAGGVFLGMITVKSGSIIPAMIMHFYNNFISVILEYSNQVDNFYSIFYNNMILKFSLIVILVWAICAYAVYMLINNFDKIVAKVTKKTFNGVVPTNYIRFDKSFNYSKGDKIIISQHAWLTATIVLNMLCTIFTFYWGYIR